MAFLSPARRALLHWGVAGWLLALIAAVPLHAQASATEIRVKAVFLFNFAQFVEWPQATLPDDDTPIRIGVLGDDPFGATLDEAVQGDTVRGHRLVVQRAARAEELKSCQIVFFGRMERARSEEALTAFRGRPVLLVSDTERFAERGGVVGFYAEGNKVRFEINLSAARDRGLKINAQLLRLARIVGPKGGG